jgi:hypothetical protein
MADTDPPCKCHTHISLFMGTQNLCHTYNVREFRSDKLEEKKMMTKKKPHQEERKT